MWIRIFSGVTSYSQTSEDSIDYPHFVDVIHSLVDGKYLKNKPFDGD
ncbi:hypothetical protein [Peribacillus saganii]|nr:hypothetical protein [Peribacillus saganii]